MIGEWKLWLVKTRGQMSSADGHAAAIGKALAQWSSGNLDARRQAIFRVARRLGTPLAKTFDLIERKIVAGKVKQRVEKHRAATGGTQKASAIFPLRIPGVVARS